ncbi:ABC transporter substrate-binding protein [Methanococcoides sp. NM1]|uniref:ABC transporter substrate-binding protein n=1 Tax=Methanococcoides sp. NM1 TaxID=1201013 RepID=UPI0010826082|nr:ABC transporter substrate-binding protein [Methanococcoides sp. NM1]
MFRNKILMKVLLALLVISTTFVLFTSPVAAYDNELPCDTNKDATLTKEELSTAICEYMLGNETNSLDDVGDASYIYSFWNGEPLTINDHYNDREVKLYRPVERVALASTPSVRIVASLNAADKIVGVYQNIIDDNGLIVTKAYPEIRNQPAIGGGSSPNAEAILAVEPDVVFYSASSNAAVLEGNTGIPVVALSATFGLEFGETNGAYNVWQLAGQILGKEERAQHLSEYSQDKIETISDISSTLPVENVKNAYIATGGNNDIIKCAPTYYSLDIAGGNNLAEGLPSSWGSATVTKEQIVLWNPDVIFIRYYTIGQTLTKDTVNNDPALAGINAVQNSSVYYIRGSSNGMDPAIAIADANRMAKQMYPDLFVDLDVEAEGNSIYNEFYNEDGLYTQMLEDFGVFERWD